MQFKFINQFSGSRYSVFTKGRQTEIRIREQLNINTPDNTTKHYTLSFQLSTNYVPLKALD